MQLDLSNAARLRDDARASATNIVQTERTTLFERAVDAIVEKATSNLQQRVNEAGVRGESELVLHRRSFGYNMWGPRASTAEIDTAYDRIQEFLKTNKIPYDVRRVEPEDCYPGSESLVIKW